MDQPPDPLARGLEAAYSQPSVLDLLAEKSGLATRIHVAPDIGGPMLRPLAAGAAASAGKYQLQGEIARGAMGAVLKGYDTHLGRDVAVKLLHEEYLGSPELLQRFVEEAQIGGQLQHPGIVPVYDLAMQGRRPFFSMKLVKGRTLAALLEERPHPAHERRRFLAIFEQVCLTMAYAHARGVIHRDIKPSNVMVGAFGEVQVVDWGMGKVLGRAEGTPRPDLSVIATVRSGGKTGSQSVVGSVMGTPAYMPPEQAMGDVDRMDERSDVFSLGATLCQILTGKPPYVGGNLIGMAAQADLAPCHGRLDACDADDDLKRLARQCLAPAQLARPKDGPPDADPPNRDHPNAWATAAGDMGRQWIELTYARAQRADRVRIFEVNVAGAVAEIETVDEAGTRRRVWEGEDPTGTPGVFEIRFPPTPYRVKSVRVVLDTNRRPGWNEIDAVELVGTDGRAWADGATASSTYGAGGRTAFSRSVASAAMPSAFAATPYPATTSGAEKLNG